jgi:hypothetical protein
MDSIFPSSGLPMLALGPSDFSKIRDLSRDLKLPVQGAEKLYPPSGGWLYWSYYSYSQIPVALPSKAWVCGGSHCGIAGSNPTSALKPVCGYCCVFSGRGLCDGSITHPEDSCWVWPAWCDWGSSWRRPSHTGVVEPWENFFFLISIHITALFLLIQKYVLNKWCDSKHKENFWLSIIETATKWEI